MSLKHHRFAPVALLLVFSLVGLAAANVAASTKATPPPVAPSLPAIKSCPGAKVCEWAALNALLPSAIASSGVLTIATDPETPPYEFYASNGTTIIGFEIDIAKAIATTLGLKAEFTALTFPGIIPAIQAGRFDISITGMADTPTREAEINFIEDSWSGESLMVQQGNPHKITDVASLCGTTAAVTAGSVPEGIIQAQKKLCPTSKKLTMDVYPNLTSTILAVEDGRANSTILDSNYAGYFILHGHIKSVEVAPGSTFGAGYNAIGVANSNIPLLLCLQQAEQRLIQSGAYANIMASWGIPKQEWLTSALVNDGLRFNQPTG